MPDNLKIGAEVDLSQVGKLTTSSQEVAASVNTMSQAFEATGNAALDMAAKFLKSGMDVETVKGALIGLGSSAKQAAVIMAQLVPPIEQVGQESQVTAGKVDGMTRALAMGATRMAAFELGAGQFGYALARVGSMSSALAPILASTFAVFGIIAFVDIVVKAAEAFEKWMHLGEETTHKMDDLTLSLSRQNDQLELTNIRIENQTAKLEHKPENFLALALAEDKLRADELTEALENSLQKMTQLLEAGTGFGSALLGKADVASIGKAVEPLERELQLAALSHNQEAQKNVLLKEQKVLRDALAAEQAKGTTEPAVGGEGMPFVGEVDQDAINTYKSALAGVQEQLDKIAKTDKNRADEAEHAAAQRKDEDARLAKQAQQAAEQQVKSQLDIAKTAENSTSHLMEIEQEAANNSILSLKFRQRMQDEVDKQQRKNAEAAAKGELELTDSLAKEQGHLANVEAKASAAGRKSIDKEAAEDYVTSWREAIKDQEEAFRDSQKKSELQMRNVSTKTSFDTAGLGQGPIKNVLESASIEAQTAIASKGLTDAKNAAASYNLELAALAAAQSKIDVSTTEGAREYQGLQGELDKLKKQYDDANEATLRWANTIQKLGAEQRTLSPNMFQGFATGAQNAAQAGFNSFNSAFIRMTQGGMSFVRVMQTAWTSMVTTFITAVLKMAEQWVVQHLIMAAAKKIMEALGLTTHIASVTGQIAANKALALSEAGLAGAGGVASMAAAPFPIDLTAPAFGSAMMAAASAFALFEHGGIVPAGLHAGEMVLPKHISTFVQTAAAGASGRAMPGAGAPGSNRPVHFHFSPNVSAMDGEGVDRVLNDHGDKFFQNAMSKIRRMGMNV